MDLNAFWALVESSAVETSDQDARLEWLTAALAAMPPAEVVDFAVRLDEQRWAVFGSVVAPPDAPADLPDVRFLPHVRFLASPEPAGEQWDFAGPSEISARIPRLGALFGQVA